MVEQTAGESIPQRGTYGCKGSQVSHRGPDAGNKGVQPIRGDGGKWQRKVGEGNQKDTSEVDQIEP